MPFSLGVLVSNAGYGKARDLRITSGQPEIIENEKGLLIKFEIISAQLGDKPSSPSLTVTFGDIEPSSTKVARWQMTSSLKGTFSNFSATFENINPLGKPKCVLNVLITHACDEMYAVYIVVSFERSCGNCAHQIVFKPYIYIYTLFAFFLSGLCQMYRYGAHLQTITMRQIFAIRSKMAAQLGSCRFGSHHCTRDYSNSKFYAL